MRVGCALGWGHWRCCKVGIVALVQGAMGVGVGVGGWHPTKVHQEPAYSRQA